MAWATADLTRKASSGKEHAQIHISACLSKLLLFPTAPSGTSKICRGRKRKQGMEVSKRGKVMPASVAQGTLGWEGCLPTDC